MIKNTLTNDIHTSNKKIIKKFRSELANFTEKGVRNALHELLLPDTDIHMPFPFGDLVGPNDLFDICYAPLFDAMPDLERRDWIVIGGRTEHCDNWVGCGGHYVGTFVGPWLDIPPTGHLTHMRFHEFYRFHQGRVVEIQTLWDIPEVMMQAKHGLWRLLWELNFAFQDQQQTTVWFQGHGTRNKQMHHVTIS